MVSEVDHSKSENQSNLSNLEHIQEIQFYKGQTYECSLVSEVVVEAVSLPRRSKARRTMRPM